MNLGELKNFLGDKPDQLSRKEALNQQLRDDALRQFSSSQSKFVSLSSTSVISSNVQIGVRVYNDSLNANLSIADRRANLPSPDQKQTEQGESLFDFEEVARNVLSFVGGAIKHAQASGADNESLLAMFDQAREGVLKGISMAEKDLAGFMNDEISEGIANSQELIELGIQRLQNQIFGSDETQAEPTAVFEASSSSINLSKSESGELSIRTRDGDEVTIRFEDLREFELNQQRLSANIELPPETQPQAGQPADNAAEQTEQAEQAQPTNQSSTSDDAEQVDDEEAIQSSEPSNRAEVEVAQQNARFYESSSFSFSVQGELDEGELAAIGELVNDANQLAEQFFYGDVEAAFQQALELGFDDQELTGFALQLTRTEQVEVVNTYESVAHFRDDGQDVVDARQAVRPVSEYLDAMLSVIEESRRLLENGEAYEGLINGLINQLGDEVHVPDLIGAINRFHGFNRQLLENLPASQETATENTG